MARWCATCGGDLGEHKVERVLATNSDGSLQLVRTRVCPREQVRGPAIEGQPRHYRRKGMARQ